MMQIHALRDLKMRKDFFDTGVAEQNLINIAWIIFLKNTALVYGFCTFLTFSVMNN